MTIYAIGDIHGRSDLLAQMLEYIRDHHSFFGAGDTPEIICIGDYIDGGPDSRGVIDTLMRGIEGFHLTCLMGNHEALMIECLETVIGKFGTIGSPTAARPLSRALMSRRALAAMTRVP